MPTHAMTRAFRRTSLRRSIAWLLWLALLVPLAQSAALLHGYSHVSADAGGHRHGEQAPQANHCKLCLTAAALAGGALLAKEAVLLVVAGPATVRDEGAASVWHELSKLGYRSRAPPFSAV